MRVAIARTMRYTAMIATQAKLRTVSLFYVVKI